MPTVSVNSVRSPTFPFRSRRVNSSSMLPTARSTLRASYAIPVSPACHGIENRCSGSQSGRARAGISRSRFSTGPNGWTQPDRTSSAAFQLVSVMMS